MASPCFDHTITNRAYRGGADFVVPGLLEHPAEAFAYFRHAGVPRVVCEEKHMGSRAVVIVCRDEEAARKSFGVAAEGIGICHAGHRQV